jgi:hypothetical protein
MIRLLILACSCTIQRIVCPTTGTNPDGNTGVDFFDDLDGVTPAMRDRTIVMTGGFLESSTEDFIEETGRPSIKKPFDLAEMARTVEG